MVAVGGDLVVDALVGSLLVVGDPIVVEGLLGGGHVGEGVLVDDIDDEGAVEAFFFAQGLGVAGPGMDDFDPEVEEPHFEAGPPVSRVG